MEVGTAEVLLDDARRVAEEARASGVDITVYEGEDLIQVWHLVAGAIPEADEGIARLAAFVRKHTA